MLEEASSAEQLVTFSCPIHHTESFSFPQRYRKDNWLKVQRQSRNGSGKGSIEGNQVHKRRKVQVDSLGESSNQEVKSTGRTVLCSVRAAKMQ